MKRLALAMLLLTMTIGACKKDEQSGGSQAAADYPDEPRPSEVGEPETGRSATAKADPHAGMGSKPGAAMTSPGPGPADLGGIEVTIPKGWKPEPLKSRMRAAQYGIGDGDARVEVAVFYFQKRGAGDVKSNFERWRKQFQKLDGEPTIAEKMVGQMKVHTIDMTGTFGGGPPMRPMAGKSQPKPGARMIGAIVESPAGPYYFKMTGPKAEVEQAADGFTDMIESAKPSEL